jgi:hypothetical protein
VRILFDQGTPEPLRRSLMHHEVATAYECGWAKLTNGDLLDAAENAKFEVLIATDSNLRYRQNLALRRIGLVVLSSPSWPCIQRAIDAVVLAVDRHPWAATWNCVFHDADA